MTPDSVEDVVVEGEEVAGGGVVRTDVGSCTGDLRGAVGCGGAGDDDCADRLTRDPPRDDRAAERRGVAEEVEGGARVSGAEGVEQAWGEDVLLLHADHLFAQALVDPCERVLGWGVGRGVVDGVDGEEQVIGAEVGVEAGGAEVFADALGGAGVGIGDASAKLGAILYRPQVQ